MREKGRWELYSGQPERPLAEVILDENVAWRLFTRGIQKDQARKSAQLQGNLELAEKALDTLSIIA
jgi:chromosome segregation and condensation protein ScpB